MRASVSDTSMSSTARCRPWRGSPPSAIVRRIALVMVRVTSHGSASPNSHGRLEPVCSPAAPETRVSRRPCRPESCLAVSRSSDLPSRRMACGRTSGRRRRRAAGSRRRAWPARSPRGSGRSPRRPVPAGGERVQVQVIQAGAVVGLRRALRQVVQFGEVLQHAGAVAESAPFLTVEVFGAGPVLAGVQGLQVRVEGPAAP